MRAEKKEIVASRVGLDIGSHTVKGIELVERGAELVVRSAGAVTLPPLKEGKDKHDPGALISAVKQLWSTAGFSSTSVVMALPPESVYTKWLHLEVSDPSEFDYTARSTASRGAPFAAGEAVVDYRVLSSRGNKAGNVKFTMLVAAASKAVDELLDIAEKTHLEPLAVDVPAVAALRGIEVQKKAENMLWSGQPLAHIIIGAKHTTIVLKRSGELEFARTVNVGGNDFTQCIAETLEIGWSEAEKIKLAPGARLSEEGVLIASVGERDYRIQCESVVGRLAREIQRSLRFFSSQFAEGSYLGMVGAATVSGGGSLMKGLDVCLRSMGVEILGALNPFAGFPVEAGTGGIERVGEAAPAFTTAMGLALGNYTAGEAANAQAA